MTDSAHTKARITRVAAERILEALERGVVPVVAGFQGINEHSTSPRWDVADPI